MEAKQLFDQINSYFGFKIPLLKFEVFQQMLQMIENDDVVCGFGLLDPKRYHLYHTTGILIQAAILLKKKTYVYDEDTAQWYVVRLYQQKTKKEGKKIWHRFVRCQRPVRPFVCLYGKHHIKPSTQAYINKITREITTVYY